MFCSALRFAQRKPRATCKQIIFFIQWAVNSKTIVTWFGTGYMCSLWVLISVHSISCWAYVRFCFSLLWVLTPTVCLCLTMSRPSDDEFWARRFRRAVYQHDNFRSILECSLATVLAVVWLYNKYRKLYEYFNEGLPISDVGTNAQNKTSIIDIKNRPAKIFFLFFSKPQILLFSVLFISD